MGKGKSARIAILKAIEAARLRGDEDTALKFKAVLKALDEVEATVIAALAAVVATL